MPKCTKRFVLSDSSVNRYGFRVLTSGIDISQFQKNPICYFSHKDENGEEIVLPIGHWQDIEVEGDKITAVPFLSDDDPFAMKIFGKVEEGTLRMASAGLDPTEVSDNPALMLANQVLPTVTKSVLYEASICPQGVNNNALTMSVKGRLINLSTADLRQTMDTLNENSKHHYMTNPKLLALAIKLGLTAQASEDSIIEAMEAKVGSFATLASEVGELKTQLAAKKTELEALQKAAEELSIGAMLDKAESEGRLSADERPEMLELAKGNRELVEKMLTKRTAHVTAQTRLAEKTDASNPILKLSYDEADKQGVLEVIKKDHPAHFAALFKAKWGKEPK